MRIMLLLRPLEIPGFCTRKTACRHHSFSTMRFLTTTSTIFSIGQVTDIAHHLTVDSSKRRKKKTQTTVEQGHRLTWETKKSTGELRSLLPNQFRWISHIHFVMKQEQRRVQICNIILFQFLPNNRNNNAEFWPESCFTICIITHSRCESVALGRMSMAALS